MILIVVHVFFKQTIKKLEPEKNDVEKITLLVDFTGVGMGLAGVDNTKISIEVLNILQNHYPEVRRTIKN